MSEKKLKDNHSASDAIVIARKIANYRKMEVVKQYNHWTLSTPVFDYDKSKTIY